MENSRYTNTPLQGLVNKLIETNNSLLKILAMRNTWWRTFFSHVLREGDVCNCNTCKFCSWDVWSTLYASENTEYLHQDWRDVLSWFCSWNKCAILFVMGYSEIRCSFEMAWLFVSNLPIQEPSLLRWNTRCYYISISCLEEYYVYSIQLQLILDKIYLAPSE